MKRYLALMAFSVALGQGTASALPVFTLDPSAVGLAGTKFSGDNLLLSDFATVTFTPSGTGASFTDNGVLPIIAVQNGSRFVTASGLNTAYVLYFEFSGTGIQNTAVFGPTSAGIFDSLSYTLYGANILPGGNVSYVSSNTAPTGIATPVALAKGELITGGVGATNTPAGPGIPATTTPTATVFTAFSLVPGNSGFFVSPTPFYQANVATFTNTPTQFQATDTGFTITEGGGAANFLANPSTSVPEPMSLALMGSMVTVAAFARARKHT